MSLIDIEQLLRESAIYQHQAEIELEKRKRLTEYLCHVSKSGCPRKIKDEALLAMFSDEFKKKIGYNALETNIFHVLSRDGDIFKLIENLVENINRQESDLKQLIEKFL